MPVDLTAVAALITICSTAVVSIVHTVQQSRCTKISACCITCDRTLANADSNSDINNDNLDLMP
jgi:hypothetical protein